MDLVTNYGSLGLHSGNLTKESVVRGFLKTNRLHNLAFKAIRTELLLPASLDEAEGLYYFEDRFECARVIQKAENFFLLDKPLYFYRINPGSTTQRPFEVDDWKQQSFIEKSIADQFSANYALDGLQRNFLRAWANNMTYIAEGRTIATTAGSLKDMSHDAFFEEVYAAVGVRSQRIDRRVLLTLFHAEHYVLAAIIAKLISVLVVFIYSFAR